MGCTTSKDTETDNQNKPKDKKNDKKDDKKNDKPKSGKKGDCKDKKDPWEDKDEAVKHVMEELKVSKEAATRIVERASRGDEKLSSNELKAMWKDIEKLRDDLKPKFEDADTNNSGKVTVTEATRVLKDMHPDMNEKALKKLFKQFDSGDGIIQLGEFTVFYYYLQSVEKELRPAFAAADENHTGVVTIPEARKVLAEKFPKLDEKAIHGLLRKYDSGDAVVNYVEFIYFYANLKQAKNSLSAKFDKLDKNKDGELSVHYVVKLVAKETGMDEEDCHDLVHAADTSNDGDIDKDEFLAMWSNFI